MALPSDPNKLILTDGDLTRAGALKAALDSKAAATRFRSGTGSPQGVVAAPVCTEYTDTAGTTGAWKWLKKTGTGTTGWEVTEGDTGPRDITSLITFPITSGALYIQRVVGLVTLTFSGVVLPSDRTGVFGFFDGVNPIPPGFAKQLQRYRVDELMGSGASTQTPSWMTWYGYNTVRWLGRGVAVGGDSPSAIDGAFVVATTDPWPTSLPGTPA